MFFKKKTQAEIVAEDRKLIEANSNAIGKLAMLVKESDAFTASLKELQEKIKYLKPVSADDAMKTDRHIGNAIDDLKIELSKNSGAPSSKADGYITEIKRLIVSRKD